MRITEGNVKGKNRENRSSTILGGLRDTKKSEITFKIHIGQKWEYLAMAPKSFGNSIYLCERRQISIPSGTKKWCRNFGQCTTIALSLSFTFRVAAYEELHHKVGESPVKIWLLNLSDLTQATNCHQQRRRWSIVTKTWATTRNFIPNFEVLTFVLMKTQVFCDMRAC
jgi:hypothetical protein